MRPCTCGQRRPQFVDGLWLCGECGDPVPDPGHAALLLSIGRLIDSKLKVLREELSPSAPLEGARWIGPAEVGRRLGRGPQWVRDHWQELGGQRIGEGPRPRYHFDPERIEEIRKGRAM
jgi:hypothetical protein